MNTRVTDTRTEGLYSKFPHLRRIDQLWGTSDCRKFLFSLMTDTRGGTRQGFPPEHAGTVMSLLMEHDRKFPQFENDVESHDTRWGDVQRRGLRDS